MFKEIAVRIAVEIKLICPIHPDSIIFELSV